MCEERKVFIESVASACFGLLATIGLANQINEYKPLFRLRLGKLRDRVKPDVSDHYARPVAVRYPRVARRAWHSNNYQQSPWPSRLPHLRAWRPPEDPDR